MSTRPRIPLDGHYTFVEAAALLGKDRRTIYRWRKMGYLPETRSRLMSKGFILGKHILKAYDALC